MNICPQYHAFCNKYGATTCGGDCAAVVNAIRNEPFNTLFGGIDESIRLEGIYASVKKDCHE